MKPTGGVDKEMSRLRQLGNSYFGYPAAPDGGTASNYRCQRLGQIFDQFDLDGGCSGGDGLMFVDEDDSGSSTFRLL